MAKTFLKIITPNGLFWNKEVDIVTVKTTEGYIGILHGKSPISAALDIAELHINAKNSPDFMECAIAGGILYANQEKVEIITDAIEEKTKIDINRAEKAKRAAEIALKAQVGTKEHDLADLALRRALNRISIKKG